jgi:hypothetical protein
MSQPIVSRVIDKYPVKTVFLPLAVLQAPFLLFPTLMSEWWIVVAAPGAVFAICGQVTINDGLSSATTR